MTLFELSKDQVRELREDLAYGYQIPFTTDPNDITDEMLVEMYRDTIFSNDDFTAKPRECVENYFPADGLEETECCPYCHREIVFSNWDIRTDGFIAYCPHCGNRIMLCNACRYRFGDEHCEYKRDCNECPFVDTGFAEDDVYDWGDLNA